jgi:energy-coupling factor transporter transmembrane protein EcfT
MMLIHPTLQIITWCLFIALMQRLDFFLLCLIVGLLLTLSAYLAPRKLVQLLRRTRWILVSLLLIYAYARPGQALLPMLGNWSPVREGLQDGAAQLLKLLAALASLAMLLEKLPRLQLMAGLYSLFAPLKFFGISRERCAIRLALTLHYAELAMLRKNVRWQDTLQDLFTPHESVLEPIILPVQRMTRLDYAVALLLFLFALGLMLK